MSDTNLIHHDLSSSTAACWRDLLNEIDHFLNNKLPALRTKNAILKDCLPELLKGYQLSVENKLLKDDSIEINLISKKPELLDSEPEISAIFHLMDAIQLFCDTIYKSKKSSEIVSSEKLVNELLDSYPFKDNERDLIKFNPEKNFDFAISPIFIKGAIHNLIKFYLGNLDEFSEKGTAPHHAELYFSDAYNKNFTIHFRIYSQSIKNSKPYHLFEKHFSIENGQVVPGLGLCHLSLLYAGTNVSYTIKDEEYLDVSITIPKLDLPENNELCAELQGLIFTKDTFLLHQLKGFAKNLGVNLDLISLPESILHTMDVGYGFVILHTWVNEPGDGIELINSWKKTGKPLPLFFGYSQDDDTHDYIENPKKFGLEKCFTLEELSEDPLIFKNIVLETRKKLAESVIIK